MNENAPLAIKHVALELAFVAIKELIAKGQPWTLSSDYNGQPREREYSILLCR